MPKEKMLRTLSDIYKESRNTEIQVNRSGINNKEALKITLCLISDLTTIMSEMLKDV